MRKRRGGLGVGRWWGGWGMVDTSGQATSSFFCGGVAFIRQINIKAKPEQLQDQPVQICPPKVGSLRSRTLDHARRRRVSEAWTRLRLQAQLQEQSVQVLDDQVKEASRAARGFARVSPSVRNSTSDTRHEAPKAAVLPGFKHQLVGPAFLVIPPGSWIKDIL